MDGGIDPASSLWKGDSVVMAPQVLRVMDQVSGVF